MKKFFRIFTISTIVSFKTWLRKIVLYFEIKYLSLNLLLNIYLWTYSFRFFCKILILKGFLWAHVRMQSNKPPRLTLTTFTKLIFTQTTTLITIATKNEILLTYNYHLPNTYNLETAVGPSQISQPLPNRPQIRLIYFESTIAV